MLRRGVSLNSVARRWCSGKAQSSEWDMSDPPKHVRLSPSERAAMYQRFIRVDHAGELGAQRIYQGQMAVLGRTKSAPMIAHMAEQEKEHLDIFERLVPAHNVRPSALLPFWNVAGFVLGASTALLGKEAAMACTVAVEESITQHYNEQIRSLIADDPEANKDLLRLITKCRDDEVEHHNIGLEQGAELAPAYQALKGFIQLGCKGAIWITEKI